jgi:hypothetical protein
MNSKYKVVTASHHNITEATDLLEHRVNFEIKQGWTPFGGVSFGKTDEIMNKHKIIVPVLTMVQAMVLNDQ